MRGPAALPGLVLAEESVAASRLVKAKSSTTTTSIRMVTVREMVVNGPCAFISEMIAMADEGERATARHAMSSDAASLSPNSSAPRKGMKRSPTSSVTERVPT